MPRAKKPALPPSNTSHLFGGRKPNDRGAAVTSARIADDLAEFRKSGGRIEVLGVTRTLTRVGTDTPPAAKPVDAPKPKKRRDG